MKTDNIDIARMDERFKFIQERLEELIKKIETVYVTRPELNTRITPLERVVYGMVGLVLTAVVVAVVALILK